MSSQINYAEPRNIYIYNKSIFTFIVHISAKSPKTPPLHPANFVPSFS